MKNIVTMILIITMILGSLLQGEASIIAHANIVRAKEKNNGITLRVCNWEEYMDLGGWDEEERILLENGVEIFGENPMYEDFEKWYFEQYGREVHVEYSCFGTNEDLYNQLNMGDAYDLVCPSEYMIMKLMAEDRLMPYSQEFFDKNGKNNYYINSVSPYIRKTLAENEMNGESWAAYAAGYMWGITGVLYNPEKVSAEEAGTWAVFNNPQYKRQVTLKDNVRDSYFAALGILKAEQLTDKAFIADAHYAEQLGAQMNDVRPETIAQAQQLLTEMMDNIYSLETDSGKADMITGKIVANYQWSGDAVYAMNEAEQDGAALKFAVPKECTNLWFDGWVMLKNGIAGDKEKQHAAEAFVNFLSRPDNAVRNMYYIGYTSSIAGGEDNTVFSYLDYCYGAEDEDEETMLYPLGYFFSGENNDSAYGIRVAKSQADRQLFAQYPPEDVMKRTAVMEYFDTEANQAINQMWIDVRCFDITEVPVIVWVLLLAAVLGGLTVHCWKKFEK